MRDQETTAQVVQVLRDETKLLIDVTQVAIHGSLVQGKQLSDVSDGDMLLLLNKDAESRLAVLNQIKSYVDATAPSVKNLLKTANSKPVSPTIVTETEFKWGVVKTKYGDNFFDTCTYNSLKPQGSNYWSKEHLWRYRHEAWRSSNSQLVGTIAKCVKNVQEARAEYCIGENLNEKEKFNLKAICRSWFFVFGGNAESGNDGDCYKGFSLILQQIPSHSSLRSNGGALSECSVYSECVPTNEDIMVFWEYTLDEMLTKLDELIPPIDKIFKDYNARVQRDWLKQWGYARDPEGVYLNKNGEALLDGDNSPISDWNLHQNRIVQEGLNAGSVEYANLFADNPNKLGPSDFDEFSESDAG